MTAIRPMRLSNQRDFGQASMLLFLLTMTLQGALARQGFGTNFPDSVPAISHFQYAMEVVKLKSGRKFTKVEGQTVRIIIPDRFGFPTVQRVRIMKITDDQVTFSPTRKRDRKQVILTDTYHPIEYMELTTAASVTEGIIIDVVIITAVTFAVIILAIMGGGSSGSGNLNGLPLDDCRKHIRFRQRNGVEKWKLNIVAIEPITK